MDTPIIEPPVPTSHKKSLFVRALVYTLAIISFILVGYIAGRMVPNECGKSVLGAQWPTFPSPTPTSTPQPNQWPHPATPTPTPTNQWPTFPSPTPTPQPNQWPTFPTATPTLIQWPSPSPNQWPHPATPTPTPSSQWPTPSPTKAPLTTEKINQLVNTAGITLINPEVTTNASSSSYVVHGNVQDKILGLIQISTPVTVTVNGNNVITGSITKPWWQQILSDPFAGLPSAINCSSITDGFSCFSHSQCGWWEACSKCEDLTTPYDPQCSCNPFKNKNACDPAYGCQWHSECAGGGICAATGTTSNVVCGGCGNVIGVDACNKQGSGCWIDSNCGRCEASAFSDPACTCSSVKTKSGCDGASNCKWHPECAGGGVCASWFDSTNTYINSKIACGGCANITSKSDCTNAGCIYSNNQCQ